MKAQLAITPSQTVGPFFTIGLDGNESNNTMASPVTNVIKAEGESILLIGKVLDGEGRAVPDALLEIRQANGNGEFQQDGQTHFARAHTGERKDNRFEFSTVKPGAINPGEAPYIAVIVYMRGLLTHGHTRLYFSDEQEANEGDAVLNKVPVSRRNSLIAKQDSQARTPTYKFDIVMQGENETVFFVL